MNEYGELACMEKEKPRYSETTLVLCHFVHCKFRGDWHEMESWHP
jgi:hypothetical protein